MDTTTLTTVTREPYQQYTAQGQIDALAALAENNGNIAATSRQTGIPEQTLRHWRDGTVRVPSPELVEQQKLIRAAKWDEVQDCAVDQVIAKLPEASAYHAALIGGIACDKAAVLRGEATAIVEHRDDARRARLAERYGQLHPVTPTHEQNGTAIGPAEPTGTAEQQENKGESGT